MRLIYLKMINIKNKVYFKVVSRFLIKNFSSTSTLINSPNQNDNIKSLNSLSSYKFSLDEIEVANKLAIMIEDNNYTKRIIFPDKKFNIEIAPSNQSVYEVIKKSKQSAELDGILSINFLDRQGEEIANNSDAEALSRLDSFIVSLDRGEKNYLCVNSTYLGNKDLSNKIDLRLKDNNNFEKLIFENDFSFKDSLARNSISCSSVSFEQLLNHILNTKYSLLNEIENQISITKEQRFAKALNFYFYLATFQVISLNLCTFVFLNWDFMEPITQCLTFANIIAGYYFWVFTKGGDYDPEGFSELFKSKTYIRKRKYLKNLYFERELIKSLLESKNTSI